MKNKTKPLKRELHVAAICRELPIAKKIPHIVSAEAPLPGLEFKPEV
jgi:hypothetical protein